MRKTKYLKNKKEQAEFLFKKRSCIGNYEYIHCDDCHFYVTCQGISGYHSTNGINRAIKEAEIFFVREQKLERILND